MKIVFISNILNPHQYPLAKELYKITDGNYHFVEMEPLPKWLKDGGYPMYVDCPWLVRAWLSDENKLLSRRICLDADIMIVGGCYPYDLIKARLDSGKIVFYYGERWLKRGWLNLFSPRLLRDQWYYHKFFHERPIYFLAASAFAAKDYYKLHSFRGRCFKWGYFPATDGAENEELNYAAFHDKSGVFKIMTVCRMLNWKRPEMMVEAAKYLRDNGVKFVMDMYGSGERLSRIQQMIGRYNLNDNVILHGNIPNEEIHKEMQRHHCLLFTSNQREGWGAVVNEAMANGCVVVGASKIGSIPYLIEDGVNGLVFEDGDQDDLNKKLYYCATNIPECETMAREARKTITTIWSPKEAAKRLIILADALIHNETTPYKNGPCSVAPLL